jgi:hypothetical protein
MTTKIIKIENGFEIWGFFLEGMLIKTKKLKVPFNNR